MRNTGLFPFSGILAAAALLALASGADAQPMTQPGKPPASAPVRPDDPAKVAVAKEFLVVFHPRSDPKNVSVMIDQTMPAFIKLAKQSDPKLDVKKFSVSRKTQLMARAVQSLDMQAHVVSRHFSLQELKGLTGFYRGPLGRKLTDEIPKIQMGIMQEARLRRQAQMPPPKANAKPAPPHK